mgnify:CR=1 FL=1
MYTAVDTGSSPLARGLLVSGQPNWLACRIIPARAGFTHCWRQGSSSAGIIPARAGFTEGGDSPSGGRSDHPRSRGVYHFIGITAVAEQGSSPLARGLPEPGVYGGTHLGIIPARAGFTSSLSILSRIVADHPRSRGVYAALLDEDGEPWGSSPLARGLRVSHNCDRLKVRIIPARAGFTPPSCLGSGSGGDHPRSRGVYPAAHVRSGHQPGSSPLARGLPIGHRKRRNINGIIPARAGFTQIPVTLLTLRRDHPRSRGVYQGALLHDGDARGSSPLARGLQTIIRRSLVVPGIIPARAGFTLGLSDRGVLLGDHPRSRGVYSSKSCTLRVNAGSSPLARGLHIHELGDAGLQRIIPARAGFT